MKYQVRDRIQESLDAHYMRWKEKLGNDWAALDPERRYFKMVTRGNMQTTLKELEDL